jgi:uncharacterized protein (DUF1501 family)
MGRLGGRPPPWTADSFALEAGRVGRLLRERPHFNLGFIDIGGWDTHAGEGAASGALANRLEGLGSGLAELHTPWDPGNGGAPWWSC